MNPRAYFFGNMYLSSIQQGIQAGHTLGDMFVKYQELSVQKGRLLDWAENYKVMILLNAGYSDEIRSLAMFLGNNQNKWPWASFSESDEALDGALTCVGIVLPEEIYTAAAKIRNDILDPEDIVETGMVEYMDEDVHGNPFPVSYEVNEWEYKMILRLNNYGMAK